MIEGLNSSQVKREGTEEREGEVEEEESVVWRWN
jgi:hypothetical protein